MIFLKGLLWVLVVILSGAGLAIFWQKQSDEIDKKLDTNFSAHTSKQWDSILFLMACGMMFSFAIWCILVTVFMKILF